MVKSSGIFFWYIIEYPGHIVLTPGHYVLTPGHNVLTPGHNLSALPRFQHRTFVSNTYQKEPPAEAGGSPSRAASERTGRPRGSSAPLWVPDPCGSCRGVLDPRGSHKRSACSPPHLIQREKAPLGRASAARARSGRSCAPALPAQAGRCVAREVPARSSEHCSSEVPRAAPPTRRELRKMSLLRKWGRGPACAKVPRFAQIAATGARVRGAERSGAAEPNPPSPCPADQSGAKAGAVRRAATKEPTKARARAEPALWIRSACGAAHRAPRPSARRAGDAVGAHTSSAIFLSGQAEHSGARRA